MVFWQNFFYRIGPFDEDDVLLVFEVFGEVFFHDAGVGKAVKIIMNEKAAIFNSVGFRNSEARASYGVVNTETFRETADKGRFPGANVA